MKIQLSVIPGFPNVGKSPLPAPYEWRKNVALTRTQNDRVKQLIDLQNRGEIDIMTLVNKVGKMLRKRGISLIFE